MKTILLLTPTSNMVLGFRKKLIEDLQKSNYKVSVLTLDDNKKKEIESHNIVFFSIKDKNRSLNPLKILSLPGRYAKIIKQISPDIVFSFMLKPNTLGVLGAHKAGIRTIYSMVEGLGDPFTYNSVKWNFIRLFVSLLYKKSLKYCKKVFFLNNEDKEEFVRRKLTVANKCEIVHGIGVDLNHFDFRPARNKSHFLMIARMLETKGVLEYCKCARIIKSLYPEAIFDYLGDEGTVKLGDIKEYIDDGSINYLGVTSDVRPFIENCSVFVLPSFYREGLPASIMEAESIGRCIITTNNVGCKDTIIDGENGFLTNKRDIKDLTNKMVWCIEHPDEVKKMGEKSRDYAERNFDSIVINKIIISALSD